MRELLQRYIKKEWKRISAGFVIKFIGTVTDLFIPWTLAYIINRVTPTGDIGSIVLLGSGMIAMAVAGLVLNIVANRNANYVSKQVTTSIRRDLFTSILYLTRNQTDTFTVPSLISRVTTDSYNVHAMVGMSQRLGVRAPILLLGGITVTLLTDTVLALILLALQPLIFLTVITISKKGLPLYAALQKQIDRIVLVMRENISGVRIIKALGKDEYERRRFHEVNGTLIQHEKKTAKLMAMTNPLITLYLNIGLALVVLAGAFRVRDGSSEIGTIIAFLSYFTMIINSMYAISRIFIISTKGMASYKRISEIINTDSNLKILDIPKEESAYHIEFRDVSFSYYKNKNNLTDISFRLKKGQTLGIIGPTGSGKTTIIRLLMRFYDVSTGKILINGRDVRSIPFDELYNMFG
ncbi:MAG: ABC transporter ATP-binding protein, partial [Bacillota bacterium]|nr:ABC transporter ATP-binding protein [Bacillota bacterium]